MKHVPAALILALAAPMTSHAGSEIIAPGRYRIAVRIEIPNVDTRDYDFTQTLCLADGDLSRLGPLGPGPMRNCPRRVRLSAEIVTIEVTCKGPNAGTAIALYTPVPGGFQGTVNMNMGGKNMTLTERHRAQRIGECAE